ncbi:MAG: hypothetical protein QF404_01250 [Planctomycetota bacterium]|nr:hypothetical protein [Planctomycetota bacterium]
MTPFIKTLLIAMVAGAVYGVVTGALTDIFGEPNEFSKGVVICVIVYFAIQIANKSDVQPPEEDPSD